MRLKIFFPNVRCIISLSIFNFLHCDRSVVSLQVFAALNIGLSYRKQKVTS